MNNKPKFDFVAWMRGSFDNLPGGASSKKISAFWALVILASPPVFLWVTWAFIHNDWALLPAVLTIILGFVAAALGINMIEKVVGKEKGSNEENNTGNPA